MAAQARSGDAPRVDRRSRLPRRSRGPSKRWLLARDAKTAAGVRHVTIRPGLLDALTVFSEHAAHTDPHALVFASETGRPFGPSNYRRRVLAKAVERADKRLKRADRAPLPNY